MVSWSLEVTAEDGVTEVCVMEVCVSDICDRLSMDVIDKCTLVEISSGERERVMADIFNESFEEFNATVLKDDATILSECVTALEVSSMSAVVGDILVMSSSPLPLPISAGIVVAVVVAVRDINYNVQFFNVQERLCSVYNHQCTFINVWDKLKQIQPACVTHVHRLHDHASSTLCTYQHYMYVLKEKRQPVLFLSSPSQVFKSGLSVYPEWQLQL